MLLQSSASQARSSTTHQDLLHQQQVAQQPRLLQDDDVTDSHAEASTEGEVKLLLREAKALLQSMPSNLDASGAVSVAKCLVERAMLNQDQRAPVALIAKDMQKACVQQGKQKRTTHVGKILRMPLLKVGDACKQHLPTKQRVACWARPYMLWRN